MTSVQLELNALLLLPRGRLEQPGLEQPKSISELLQKGDT